MNNKYTKETIELCCQDYFNGIPAASIAKEFHIPISTVYNWINKKSSHYKKEKAQLKSIIELKQTIERQNKIIAILQKILCTVSAPLKTKLYNMEELYGEYDINILCEAMCIHRSTFYNHLFRNKKNLVWYTKRREELREKIQKVFDDSNQIFGANKITAVLRSQGFRCSERLVGQLMRDMGISSIRNESKACYDKEMKAMPNLVKQNFNTKRPNEI